MFVTIQLICYSLMGKIIIFVVWNNPWKMFSKVQLITSCCATSTQNVQKITSSYEMH